MTASNEVATPSTSPPGASDPSTSIPPMDFTKNAPADLPSPPFITVEGVPNFREVGGYSCNPPVPSSSSKPHSLRRNYLFRCAQLSQITPAGTSTLNNHLNIHDLYDLRSQPEITSLSRTWPQIDVSGITRHFTPVYEAEDYSPVALATKYSWYTAADKSTSDGYSVGFINAYRDIATHGGPRAYRTILTHIRDRPDAPLIFHCTAGKDRTGVLTAVIMKLCGVADDVIAWEYGLTHLGLGEWRDVIISRLMGGSGLAGGADEKKISRDEAERVLGSRAANMRVWLRDVLDAEFGGVESYLKTHCGFDDADIATLRRNLIVEGDGPVSVPDETTV